MSFYCILRGLFCIGEGTKTWIHGREQAILSGQFVGYIYWLVFSEKCHRLTFFLFFSRTMAVLLEYINPRTNILPLSILRSCKYGGLRSLFNVAKRQWDDTRSCTKPFPKQQILDFTKLKKFADDHFKCYENGRKFSRLVEYTEEKREIARYEQFLLFPQCFQKTCAADT